MALKNLSASAGDIRAVGSIPGLERSPGVGNGTLLQYSCLENSMGEKPGRLQSRGSQRVGYDWVTEQNGMLFNFFFFTLWLVLLKLIKDIKWEIQFSSATQSCPTLQPHELQHARLPCPSPTPWIYPNSCSLSPWCRGMDNFKYLKNSLLNFLSLLYLSKMISWLSCRQKFIYLFIQ